MYHRHETVSPAVPGGVTPSHGHVHPSGCYVVQCSACRGGYLDDGMQQLGVLDLDGSGYSPHQQQQTQSPFGPTYYHHHVTPPDVEFQPIDRGGGGSGGVPGPGFRYTNTAIHSQYHQPYVEPPAPSPYQHLYQYPGPAVQTQFSSPYDMGCHATCHVTYSPAPHHRNLPVPPSAVVVPQFTTPLHYTGGHHVLGAAVCNPPPDMVSSSSSSLSVVGVPQLVMYGTSGPSPACCQCGPTSASPLSLDTTMKSQEVVQYAVQPHGGAADGVEANGDTRSQREEEQVDRRQEAPKQPLSRGGSEDGGSDMNTSAVVSTVNGSVQTPRTARRSVTAAAQRGNPLYGQPDWWGEDDHLQQQQQPQQQQPQRQQLQQQPQQQQNIVSSSTSTVPSAESLWAEAAKKMTSPAARPTQLKLEPGLPNGTNSRYSSDILSYALTPPERDQSTMSFVPQQSPRGVQAMTSSPRRSILSTSGSSYPVAASADRPSGVEHLSLHHSSAGGNSNDTIRPTVSDQVGDDGHVSSADCVQVIRDMSTDIRHIGQIGQQATATGDSRTATVKTQFNVYDSPPTDQHNAFAVAKDNHHSNDVINNTTTSSAGEFSADGRQSSQKRDLDVPINCAVHDSTAYGRTPPSLAQPPMKNATPSSLKISSQHSDSEQTNQTSSSSALRENESCDATSNSSNQSGSVTPKKGDDVKVSRPSAGSAAFTVSFGDKNDGLDLSLNLSSFVPLALQRRQINRPSSKLKQQQEQSPQQQQQQHNEVATKTTTKMKKSNSLGDSSQPVAETVMSLPKKAKSHATSSRMKDRRLSGDTPPASAAARQVVVNRSSAPSTTPAAGDGKIHHVDDEEDCASDTGTYTIDSNDDDEDVKAARRNINFEFGVDESGKESPTTPSRKRQLPPVPDNSNFQLVEETGPVKQLDTRSMSDEPAADSGHFNVETTTTTTIETVGLQSQPQGSGVITDESSQGSGVTTDESSTCKTLVGDLNICELSSTGNVDATRQRPMSSPSITQTERACPPAVKLQRKTILVREEGGVLNEEKMPDKSVVREVQHDLRSDLVLNLPTKLTTNLAGVRDVVSDPIVTDESTTSGQRPSITEQDSVVINGSVVDKSASMSVILARVERPVVVTSAEASSPVALRRSAFRNGGKSNSEQACVVLDRSLMDQSSAEISVPANERRPLAMSSPMTSRRSTFANGAQRIADRGASSSSKLTSTVSETFTLTLPVTPRSTDHPSAISNRSTSITRSRSTLGTVSSSPESTTSVVPDALPRSSLSTSISASSAAQAAVTSTMFRRRGSSPVPSVPASKSNVDLKPNGRAVSSSRDSSATRAHGTRSVILSSSVSARPAVRAQSITRTIGGTAGQEKTTVGRSLSASRRPPSPVNGATFTPISKPPSGEGTTRVSDSTRTITLRQSLTPRSPDKHLLMQARRTIATTVAASNGMTSSSAMTGSRASRSINRSSMSEANASSSSSSPLLESNNITELSRTVSSQLRAITMNGARDTNGSRDSVGTSGSNESETALSASSDSSTAKNNNGQVPCNEVMIESIYALCRRIHRSVTQIHNKQRSTRLSVNEDLSGVIDNTLPSDTEKSNNVKLQLTLSLLKNTEILLKKLAN